MKVINSSYKILTNIDGDRIMKNIEVAGRTCYKSEHRITRDSAHEFVRMIIKKGHLSVLEHESISVRFIFDRGVSHEMVRHRIASYSQESTRYCNYSKDKYDNSITVIDIKNHFKSHEGLRIWEEAMQSAEGAYLALLEQGESPQIARSVLPNSLKTEIVVTANLREWITIFTQRTSKAAHPQMREVMIPLLADLANQIPAIFLELYWESIKQDRI